MNSRFSGSHAYFRPHFFTSPQNQRGSTLILISLFLLLGICSFFASGLSAASIQIERDRVTAKALTQAKQALIAYATTLPLSADTNCNDCKRPGELPCPDIDNDGKSGFGLDGSCGSANGTHPEKRLGRFPWKTLDTSDLRDGYGERLWYAVSTNFKNNTRYLPLNSDTSGTITLRDTKGSVIVNGQQNGVVAVIIAPGAVLRRQDTGVQDRTCARDGGTDSLCVINNVCATDPTRTSMCNPVNYLDAIPDVEDNAKFIDRTLDGFVSGPVSDSNGDLLVNDRILTITIDEIMPQVENRVMQEVRSCLGSYAAQSGGQYPWAAMLDPSQPPTDADIPGTLFGRVPKTLGDVPNCTIKGGWWKTNHWQELIFYGLSSDFSLSGSLTGKCENCLRVSPSDAPKKFVLVAAGRKLDHQRRTSNSDKSTIGNYLELENSTPADGVFQQSAATTSFNDKPVFWPAL